MHAPARNGGFPEPPASEPQRLVRVRHPDCRGETRVRLPRVVPAGVVRRVVCERCARTYECDGASESGTQPSRHSLRPRLLGLAFVAAGLGLGALLWLVPLNGANQPAPSPAVTTESDDAPAARSIIRSRFSLALPPGWKEVRKEDADFAAAAQDGGAEMTLWIERDPALSFKRFENQSTSQLESLSGEVEVVERIDAPTAEGRVVRLRTDAPPKSGVTAPYEVTLRAFGPYRYYLATTLLPGASPQAANGVGTIHASFIPRGEN